MSLVHLPAVQRLMDLALDEDIGRGDVTTDTVVDREQPARAVIVAREGLVLYGLELAAEVFRRVAADTRLECQAVDGDWLESGAAAATVHGRARALLVAERTALNFLQRLSGVATQARRYAEAVAGTGARVVDTRKTTPGYRALEKAAVVAGGCFNHRFDLGSGVLIKDNHIAACGTIAAAVARARARAPHSLRVEVEVTTLAELDEALAAGADVVLIDNMGLDDAAVAVERAHSRGVLVEASGGITLETIRDYARRGVDLISVGALTHSARAVDLALDFVDRP
jgi:nicotinate-nucleotide pyrophosphorylase (carboxylating)